MDEKDLGERLELVARLDALAETAELMGDTGAAAKFREAAAHQQSLAMDALDD